MKRYFLLMLLAIAMHQPIKAQANNDNGESNNLSFNAFIADCELALDHAKTNNVEQYHNSKCVGLVTSFLAGISYYNYPHSSNEGKREYRCLKKAQPRGENTFITSSYIEKLIEWHHIGPTKYKIQKNSKAPYVSYSAIIFYSFEGVCNLLLEEKTD